MFSLILVSYPLIKVSTERRVKTVHKREKVIPKMDGSMRMSEAFTSKKPFFMKRKCLAERPLPSRLLMSQCR